MSALQYSRVATARSCRRPVRRNFSTQPWSVTSAWWKVTRLRCIHKIVTYTLLSMRHNRFHTVAYACTSSRQVGFARSVLRQPRIVPVDAYWRFLGGIPRDIPAPNVVPSNGKLVAANRPAHMGRTRRCVQDYPFPLKALPLATAGVMLPPIKISV